MRYQLRKCEISDLGELTRISRETFIAAFEKENNPEDFTSYIDSAFSKKKLLSELKQAGSHFYFAYLNKSLVAYLKLNVDDAQNEFQEPSGVELERIYVDAPYQGKNIGMWLLKELESIARQMGKRYIWLGVWEHNPKAIRFYERHGFIRFGTHPYYIGKDKQTDWLMRKDL